MTNDELIQMLNNLKDGLTNNEIRTPEKISNDEETRRYFESEVQRYQSLIEDTSHDIEEARQTIAGGEAEKATLLREIDTWNSLIDTELERNTVENISDVEREAHVRNVSNLRSAIASNEDRIDVIDNAPAYLATKEAELADYESSLASASEYLDKFVSIINNELSSSTLAADIDRLIEGLNNGTLTPEQVKETLENYLDAELTNVNDVPRIEKIENIDRLITGLVGEISNLEAKLSDDKNYSSSIFEDAQFKQNIDNLQKDLTNANLALATSIATNAPDIDYRRANVKNIEDKIEYYKEKLANPVRQAELTNDRKRLERLKSNLENLKENRNNLDFDVREQIQIISAKIDEMSKGIDQVPVQDQAPVQDQVPVQDQAPAQDQAPVQDLVQTQDQDQTQDQTQTKALVTPLTDEQRKENLLTTLNKASLNDDRLSRLEQEGVYFDSNKKTQKVTEIKEAPKHLKDRAKAVLSKYKENLKKVKDHFKKYWFEYAVPAVIIAGSVIGFNLNKSADTKDTDAAKDMNQANIESQTLSEPLSNNDILNIADNAIASADFENDLSTSLENTIEADKQLNGDYSQYSDEELGKMIIHGDFGNGQARKDALGDDYARGQSWVDANWHPAKPSVTATTTSLADSSLDPSAQVGWVYQVPQSELPAGAISQTIEVVDNNVTPVPSTTSMPIVHEDPNPDTSLQEGVTYSGGEVTSQSTEPVSQDNGNSTGTTSEGDSALDVGEEVTTTTGGEIIGEETTVISTTKDGESKQEDALAENIEIKPGETFVDNSGKETENMGEESIIIPGEVISTSTEVVDESEIPNISDLVTGWQALYEEEMTKGGSTL